MNDGIDLRKRILKMRENNASLGIVEHKDIKEDIKEDIKNTLKSSFLMKNEPEIPKDKKVQLNKNEKTKNKLLDNNEVQFRILANKFNEAVEVILELSEKVKKLEKTVYKEDSKLEKISFFSFFSSLKILMLFILVPLFILGIFSLPFDTSMIKLILRDIFSLI